MPEIRVGENENIEVVKDTKNRVSKENVNQKQHAKDVFNK